MPVTHHSEYLKIKSIYIKPAANAFVSQAQLHAQWEELNYVAQPNFEAALNEYSNFENILRANIEEVHHFPPDQNVMIDSIYCRDAAIATDFGMIICTMGKAGRINEPEHQKQTFIKAGIPILGEVTAPGSIEGGDVVWLDEKTLAVGHSYRTNPEGIRQLKALLEPKGITIRVVVLPHFRGPGDILHLMSLLSPVDNDLAVVYSPLLPIDFREELTGRGFQFVEVPEDEYDSMGPNVLALAPRKCIMVEGNPKTRQALIDAGCEVITYKGNDISVKGCGGPTCLTRPMVRDYMPGVE